jgi:hypothetical protein
MAPILLEQPLVFQSQTELFIWLEQVQNRKLDGVRTLTLYLQDLDISSLDDEFSWPILSPMELYQLEADKILSMLKPMSGVRELSIYHVANVQSYLYENFVTMVLKKIPAQFFNLKSFSYHSDGHPVDFLKSLTSLRELRFTGYSKSTPMETLSVLSRLRHLRSVELIPPVIPEVIGGFGLDSALPTTLSVTRDVIRGLRRLESLTIREASDYLMSPAYMTATFVKSIDSRHRMSLQRFEISITFTPDTSCQRALQSLLLHSSMRHISLVWPKLNDRMMEALPRTTETLRVSPFSDRAPHWVLKEVQRRRKELPNLHTVYLVCDSESGRLSSHVRVVIQKQKVSTDLFQAASPQTFKAPIKMLSDIGVQTVLQYGRDSEH